MIGVPSEDGSNLLGMLGRRCGIDDRPIHQARLALGDRACLVQRDSLEPSSSLEVNAALDQDAARRAAAASPLTIVTGVDITSAHGQAMTSNTSAL